MNHNIQLDYQEIRDCGSYEFREYTNEDRYELYLALSPGWASLTYDGKLIHEGDVFAGMVRLVAPGKDVRGAISLPCEWVALLIPGTAVRDRLGRLGTAEVDPPLRALLTPHRQVERLGRVLAEVRDLDPANLSLCVEGVASALLAYLAQWHRAARAEDRCLPLSRVEYRQAEAYADAAMALGLDVGGWAAELGLTAADFSRRFRRTTGLSPYAWFVRRRIERAKLLADPRRSLVAIALEVGYSNQSDFTEAFRQVVGVAPGQWRAGGRRPGQPVFDKVD